MSKEPKCISGCKAFIGGEIKHHSDCPFYPESLSKMFVDLKADNERLIFALNEISFGGGAYDPDRHQHAENCIRDMKALAVKALSDE